VFETEGAHFAFLLLIETVILRAELTEMHTALDSVQSYASKQEQKAWILAYRVVSSQGGVTITTKLNAHLSIYRRCEGFVCGPSSLLRRIQSFD
jgi:hypothetical protein